MKTRVQMWGNSLAVRIPKAYASELGLEPDANVEVSLSEGKLLVEPVNEKIYRLEDLLSGITKENLHREIDSGPAQGDEVW